jgi:DNA-binding FrmR family transcriptional regulator
MTEHEHHQNKQKALITAKKAYGINAKVLEMIEQDAYCPDVIQQVDAVIGLLTSAKKTLLRGHLNHCLQDNLTNNRQSAIEELIKILDLK